MALWTMALVDVAWAAEPWRGVINQAAAEGPSRWAGPFPDELARLAGRFGGAVDPDLEALPTDVTSRLYGDSASHPALARVLAWHGITLDADGVTIGGVFVRAPSPFVIAALAHPEQPDRPVLVYTAWDEEAQPRLNTVFHGPTALVIGSSIPGLRPVYTGGYDVDPASGRVVALATGPATLTRAEALADLAALTAGLVRGYGDLEALDWDAREADAAARLAAAETWAWSEVWDVLLDALSPVADYHFTASGGSIGADGEVVSHRARLVAIERPYFADGRLIEGEAWSFEGEAIEPPPAVPGPHDLEAGVVYRFPTVLADGSPAWLVGVFAAEDPGTLRLGERVLAVHAPRTDRGDRAAPFAVDEVGEVPVLSVTTMNAALLEGLTATALPLRRAERVVLDLRGNGGGSDTPARQWATAFHRGPYRWTDGADLELGDGDRADRWRSFAGGTIGGRGRPYRGELRVLVDGGVASSGETFVQLAAQIPGATIYGVPTAGCSRIGNVEAQPPLPSSRIALAYGHTRFDWDDVRPVREGRGIFPDVWLDEADPVAFVAALPD